jgi:hypothetical protein
VPRLGPPSGGSGLKVWLSPPTLSFFADLSCNKTPSRNDSRSAKFFQREYVADDESAIALLRKLYSKYLPSAISGADSVADKPT